MLQGMAFVFDEDDCSVDSLRMTIYTVNVLKFRTP